MSITVDREECLLRGYIPLDSILSTLQSKTAITEVSFEGNGYVTDAILHILFKHLQSGIFKELAKVNLLGCNMVTDKGIRALVKCMADSSPLQSMEILFDGCEKLSDATFSMMLQLIKNKTNASCSLKGSSVFHQTGTKAHINTAGCPKVAYNANASLQEGQLLIVPHENATTCVGEYLCSGKLAPTHSGFYKSDVNIDDWKLSVTEVHPSSCLLDNLLAVERSQVMIPFDASMEPKDIKKHLITTISRVVAKEPVWENMKATVPTTVQDDIPLDGKKTVFMEMFKLPSLDMEQIGDKTIFKNRLGQGENFGVFISSERLTRSNNYIEVKAKSSVTGGKAGLLLGCLYDILHSDRNPMESTSEIGGMVDGFEAKTEDVMTIGFGIEGDWLSEYVPGPDADFYYIEDGVKKKSKTNENDLKPNSSMYPVITSMGEHIVEVEVLQLVQPPQSILEKQKKEDRWMELGYKSDCLVDKNGRITYVRNYKNVHGSSVFLGRQEINENMSYTVEIEKVPEMFALGIVGENSSPQSKNEMLSMSFTQASDKTSCCFKSSDGKEENPISTDLIVTGDTITVKAIKLLKKSLTHIEYTLEIMHNKKMLSTYTAVLNIKGVEKVVPYISLKQDTNSPLERGVVKLNNYRPTYHRPAPFLNQVTVGRIHYLNVMDNGECQYCNPFSASGRKYGWFMGKTPLNREQLEFTVEILELDSGKLFGLGITEPDFVQENFFLGWAEDQLAYHADNGNVYHGDGTGSSSDAKITDIIMKAGDVISMKIVPLEKNELLFDADGILETRQTFYVQFYKNEQLVHVKPHTPLGEAVHPAFSVFNGRIKIHNFYPETAALHEKIDKQNIVKKSDTKKEPMKKKETRNFLGTEFIVLGVGAGSSDPAGKLQIIQQQIDGLQSDWPELHDINDSIQNLEKEFSSLDFQGQQRYGELCGVRDNMQQFQKDMKHRVRYLSVNCKHDDDDEKLKKNRETILHELVEAETRLKELQSVKYVNSDTRNNIEQEILKQLSSSKILELSKMFQTIPALSPLDGHALKICLNIMQSKGKLVLLDIGTDMLVADIGFVFNLEDMLYSLKPAELVSVDTMVPYIGGTSHVWLMDTISKEILSGSGQDQQKNLLMMLMEKCLALIRLQCLRSEPDQEQNVFTILQNVAVPQKPLMDYWTNNKDLTKFVVMKQTYKFPFSLPVSVLPLLVSNTNKYGHILVLSPRGVVYQNGAVQTIIMKQQETEEIVIESQCFLPDLESIEDCRLSKLTPSYVQDYVWNIFCVYTDIIDDLLSRSNIIFSMIKHTKKDLVNISVGCKHTWMSESGIAVVQSICTLCNTCCDGGDKCNWNGITGEYLRQSGCCSTTSGCQGCGICIPCAQELWAMRSRLRPYGIVMTEVPMTISEKNTKIKKSEDEAKAEERQALKDPLKQSIMTLDPHMFNEVEFINLSRDSKMLCLKEESDGSIMKVFPGAALKLAELKLSSSGSNELSLTDGDHIKVKLSDPLGASFLISKASQATSDKLQIFPQYFACLGREVKVIHESGIVLYDTLSNKIPVGQLIGAKPMTRDNDNFSIKVLATGESATISMGLGPKNYAPNRQPGWNTQSIGYHADDGGIYLESGSATRKTLKCAVGDIMSFYVDFTRNKGFFRKNGAKVIELNLNFNKLACFPMIGFHSIGEAVQILEKDLWTPKTEQERASNLPPAFTTYEYGNLWISPGDEVTVKRLKPKEYSGWVVLHNPIKDPVGFKVSGHGKQENGIEHFGTIEHKKDWLGNLKFTEDNLPNTIVVEWVSLESGRSYSEDDMKILFENTNNIASHAHQHRLSVKIPDLDASEQQLSQVSNGPPSDKGCLCMQVYKNLKLVNEYWLKYGHYQVSVEASVKSAKFVLRYPKSQGFSYPRGYQKGMKLYIYLESEQAYAECVVVDVYANGKNVALEYSPKDRQTSNITICMMTSSTSFNFQDFDENATILPYESRNTPSSLTQTFVTTPPYLLSEGAKKALTFMNPEWKATMLKSFADCSQVLTRVTVQERHIWEAAKSLASWFSHYNDDSHHFSFLPSQLTEEKLLFPQPTEMFSDISVHRLCVPQNEMMTIETYSGEKSMFEMPLNYAVHFADIPGIPPESHLSVDVLFGEAKNVWTYVALILSKLYLPSYKRMIPDHDGKLSRVQIEDLLYSMLQTYTSLCGIYAASWGGITFAQMNDVRSIHKAIKHADTHFVTQENENYLNPHVLIDNFGFCVCKAHFMNTCSDEFTSDELQFKYEYFEPYNELVSLFNWNHSKLTMLPQDFFKRFPNLKIFHLGYPGVKMSQFKSLPCGIGEAKKLKIVQIVNTDMESFPDDLFMGKRLENIICSNMPIKKLPTQWSESSKLQTLILSGLLIKDIPAEISKLSELRDLDICHNPITDLPDSLKDLSKLTKLGLEGCPWLVFEGKRTHLTHTQFKKWCSTNPYIGFNLGEDRVDKLFTEFDYNHNGSLDEEEIAGCNHEIFFKICRLGITDINDELTGGIPPVIFKLKSLEELDLKYNAITMVPQAINNLQNLKILNLSHNPLLESLPGSLGHLPNIHQLHVQSCPMLRTPPTEIVSRGFESVKAYLKRLAGGFTECRRTKLMVVGLGGAGKTSLLRALMSDKKQTQGTEAEIPTDGIDIIPWTVKSEDGHEVTFSTWDFAGQAVYYNTHQFFLSKRAVYLLLWSMRQGYEHAGLDFWLSSICCHAPGTPIIVIGTQCDLIPKAEIPMKDLQERYPQIASFHQVSSIKGIGINELQKNLLDVTLQQGYMGEKIPQVWLNFERRIIAERLTKKSYIKWDVARAYAMEQGIYDEKDVRMAVQLLHDLGTVQYFDNDFLRDYVVINPQWIVNVMACVVSAQDSPIQINHGRFLHKDIPVVWKEYHEDLHQWLLRLTEDFDLTFPLPKEPVNIVPCLLPDEPPDDFKWPSIYDKEGIRETKMVYRFAYLPSGLFNRAQVRLFQFSDGKMIWKKGSLLSKNKHLALIKQTDNKELVVYVQGPRPENILFLIHEVFESIIEESFNGVSYDLFLPCPDCVTKEGTTDPDLMNAKLIQRAKDLKAPFIQCYKYFHWVSMAQLQEKTPSNSREVADFDFQLQQSVVALEELNNNLTMDTAIIYSMTDVPKDGETSKLSPALIRDDILSWGYSCWFSDDMNMVSVIDMTSAIKNCKILLALVSDDFERDSKCRDMFLHAKEVMNKDIIVIVLGESMDWQNKDLGMKIGNQERKLMAKNKERYVVEGGRRSELKNWLDEKLHIQHKESLVPDVFLSYCWSNSLNAAKKSGRIHSESIGWGDPRKLKDVLENNGISCWIDTEFVGKEKKGIFADMANGIRSSKLMLAFISDEYADSDNCMMELRFGIINMELPLIAAVVGTKSGWKHTEVAMLLRRAQADEVVLQKENEEGVNVLIKYIKDALKKSNLKPKRRELEAKDIMKKEGKKKSDSSSVAYQEEFELIQRKFMRHIIGSIIAVDTMPLPRLILVDFVKSGSNKTDNRQSNVSSSRKSLRPKSASRSRDRLQIDESVLDDDEDWSTESLCIKVLCEHENGWHICPQMYPLAFRNRDSMEQFLTKAAPYLYRIYTILKQSPLKLKCFSEGKGEVYQKWIRDTSEENLDFVGAMMHLRSHLAQDEESDFLSCLARCRLPSGKIVWLCETHQKDQHVAKLTTGASGTSYNTTKVLFNEDKLFLENLEKSDIYKKLKAIKSTKEAPEMPKPVTIPLFVPPPPTIPSKDEEIEKDKSNSPEKSSNQIKDDVISKAPPVPQPLPSTSQNKDKPTTPKSAKTRGSGNSSTPSSARGTRDNPLPPPAPRTSGSKDKEKPATGRTPSLRAVGETADISVKANRRKSSGPNEKSQGGTGNVKSDSTPDTTDASKTKVKGTDEKLNNAGDDPAKQQDTKTDVVKYDITKTKDYEVEKMEDSKVDGIDKKESKSQIEPNSEEKAIPLDSNLDKSESHQAPSSKKKLSEKEMKEKQKEQIKKMILEDDNKALSKAMTKSFPKPVTQQGFGIQKNDNGISHRQLPANRGSTLRKGSNVKRGKSYSNFCSDKRVETQDVTERSPSQGSSTNSSAPSLQISTVSNQKSESSDKYTKGERDRNSSKSSTNSGKSEPFPLDRVRPKRIKVQPKSTPSDVKSRNPPLAATGNGIGVKRSSDMPLPERTTSKACILQ